MTHQQYKSFRENLHHLIHADEEVQLFEFLLRRMILTHLRHLENQKKRRKRLHSGKEVIVASADVLAAVTLVGKTNERDVAFAFERSMEIVSASYTRKSTKAPLDHLDLVAADRALDFLSNSTPASKKRLLKSCATCIETDGAATVEEVQLLRVIAETLGCPMPLVGSKTSPSEGD